MRTSSVQENWAGLEHDMGFWLWDAGFTFHAFASGKSLNSEVSLCVKWVE